MYDVLMHIIGFFRKAIVHGRQHQRSLTYPIAALKMSSDTTKPRWIVDFGSQYFSDGFVRKWITPKFDS